MDEPDLRVRLAAFAFLDERRKLSSDLFDRRELQRGFVLDGERVPLQAPQGIFKPRVCSLPLSITTVAVKEGQPRPYDEGLQAVATRVAGVVNRVAGAADDATRREQAARDDVADAVARRAHEVGRGAREVVRGAREVEQSAMASKTDHSSARS